MTECVALLRGVNVGRAKRIAMADLRELVAGLGHANVRTVLNSGNVLFRAAPGDTAALAAALEAAIAARCDFTSRVVVITAAELATIVAENPLLEVAANPSRLLVAFVAQPAALAAARPLSRETWTPDALAVGRHAAYLWCPGGGPPASRRRAGSSGSSGSRPPCCSSPSWRPAGAAVQGCRRSARSPSANTRGRRCRP